ncbi:MAG: TIGR00725 family protein [Omnitrophica WOR_2 bacterium GWA2_47_8]|nr:MAG: TIGR00725 family protein [Omnitrophica WOR_2 bacterium GWA2_47_8]
MIQRIIISVIGGHDISKKECALAQKVGALVAQAGAVLMCGGLQGVMREASKGARRKGGLTIGLLPGKEKSDANPYIDIALPTSIGFARNAIVACSADIIIALPGSHGTNSEICYGLVFNRPVIDLGNWNLPGMIKAHNIKETQKIIKDLIKKIRENRLKYDA